MPVSARERQERKNSSSISAIRQIIWLARDQPQKMLEEEIGGEEQSQLAFGQPQGAKCSPAKPKDPAYVTQCHA